LTTGSLRIAAVLNEGLRTPVRHWEPQAGSYPVALDPTHHPANLRQRVREAI
jgi:hypothetical protein